MEPFGDWSENDLAKHKMSMEWHKKQKEKEMAMCGSVVCPRCGHVFKELNKK